MSGCVNGYTYEKFIHFYCDRDSILSSASRDAALLTLVKQYIYL